MKFTLRDQPDQRLDLAPLTPDRLAGLDAKAVARIAINTTRVPVCVGDVFRITPGDPASIVIAGGSARFDNLGEAMSGGNLLLEGEAGLYAGRGMSGGRLEIRGSVGPWAASGLLGGRLEIGGDAGERLGGSLPGERTGMAGGEVVVRGNAGERAGDHLRRGLIVIEGDAGRAPGSRMIAGTIVVCGRAGRLPGYLMRHGTLLLGANVEALPPSFVPVGGGDDLLFLRLLGDALRSLSQRAAALVRAPSRRFAGDMAVLGKGEVFVARGM